MRNGRNGNRQSQAQAAPVDGVALTLAVWLGLMVGVAGLTKLSDAASTARLLNSDRSHPAIVFVERPYGVDPAAE